MCPRVYHAGPIYWITGELQEGNRSAVDGCGHIVPAFHVKHPGLDLSGFCGVGLQADNCGISDMST